MTWVRSWRSWVMIAAATAVVGAGLAPTGDRSGTPTNALDGIDHMEGPLGAAPSTTGLPDPEPQPRGSAAGAYRIIRGGADLVAIPHGSPFVRAREGLMLVGRQLDASQEWLRVFHVCDGSGWVRLSEVELVAGDEMSSSVDGLAGSVVVIDAGHGGANVGAQSAGGLVEKHVNIDIARRLRGLLESPQRVDWASGRVGVGEPVDAVGTVLMTRDGADADYEAGLDFRGLLAGVAGADAMLSIHNNAGWEIETDGPGSEAYYQSQPEVREASSRLASLVVEELRRSFAEFEADWVGARQLGAKSRLSPRDESSQYYGLLRASPVPAVIVEGAYMNNSTEAELLETDAFRQAYAEAVYRAVVRYLATDEPGTAEIHPPVVWSGAAGRGGASDDCEIPTQP